jgi:hypothetical protein
MTEPRTAAGREVLRRQDAAGLDESQLGITVEDIRRIEREMYDLASNDGYHAGINDCREHDPAHQAATDSEALRAALEAIHPYPDDTEDFVLGFQTAMNAVRAALLQEAKDE